MKANTPGLSSPPAGSLQPRHCGSVTLRQASVASLCPAAFTWLVLLSVFLAFSAHARTIYVSFAGSDTSGDGTASKPYRTVTKAHTRAADGDLISVRAGQYRETLNLTKRVGMQSSGGTTVISLLGATPTLTVFAGYDQRVVLDTNSTGGVEMGPLSGTVRGQGGLPLSVQWSQVTSNAAVQFSRPHELSTTARFFSQGTYVLRLTASTSQASGSDDLVVEVVPPGGPPLPPPSVNRAPSVNAGSDQTIPLGDGVSLGATVSDDGKPNPPGVVTVQWSKISGPSGVTLQNATSSRATARFTTAGTYVFRAVASDSVLSAFDDVTVTVSPGRAPTVNAGSTQTITLPGQALLQGQASDDGLPNPPGRVTVTWSKLSGPGTVTFANPNALATSAAFSTDGDYVLRLGATDGLFERFGEVLIHVRDSSGATPQPPVVSAGPDQTVYAPASASLQGSVSDDGLPRTPGRVTSRWTKVSGPGSVSFVDSALPITRASFTEVGVYVLRLTASDGLYERRDDLQVTFSGGGSCSKRVQGSITYAINGSYGYAVGARVEAIRDGIVYGRVTSGSQGHYEMVGLPCGQYTMRAIYNGYAGEMTVWLHSDYPYPTVECSILASHPAVMAVAAEPTLPEPASMFAPARLPDGSKVLTFYGWLGEEYEIQYSTDLLHWTGWTNVICTAPESQVVDTDAATAPVRFYRLRMVE